MNTPEEKTIGAVLGIFALAAALLLSACNTVKGVGRDIESVGSAGQKAINK
ncbi:MAG: entericidin A/B family lipoprotein [Sphingobium sp.]